MSFISSIASVIGVNLTEKPVTAAMSELDVTSGQEKSGTFQAFQYFPETISDSKSPNYSRRNIPGGSHPIQTFLDGGERSLSFTAVFTQDDNPEEQGLASSLFTGSFDLTSAITTAISGGTKKQSKHTVDIAAAIAWLRSYTYPEYTTTGAAKPPPLCILYLPNSGILGHPNFTDSIVGVMTQCDVVYEAFHRNGAPRYVAVNLGFVESVQIGPKWSFVGRESFPKMLTNSGRKAYTREVVGARKIVNTSSSGPEAILGDIKK
jgi:hypothetical protein